MVSSLVNKDNSHVGGLLSSNQGAVKGFGGKVIGKDGSCTGIKQYGGKKHKKRTHKKKSKKRKHKRSMRNKRKSKKRMHKKKTHKKRGRKHNKKSRKYKKRGGAVLEPHRPIQGLHSILTRGGNASRGLSNAERAKLIGGGVGYGMTASNATMQANAGEPAGIGMGNHNSAGITITGYKNCNITPDFKHGAGSNWKSLDRMQIGAGMVDKYNNMTAGAYGYVPEGDNRAFAGSYPPVKPIARAQQCGKGGKKKKKKGGKKQKGGYAQYNSNIAMTHTQQMPNGSQGGTWTGQLANPPTFSRANLCRDNYNHFTGKTMRSPVLDQDVNA
jgi:hypothetical protein